MTQDDKEFSFYLSDEDTKFLMDFGGKKCLTKPGTKALRLSIG